MEIFAIGAFVIDLKESFAKNAFSDRVLIEPTEILI